jgi:hypothetical protein
VRRYVKYRVFYTLCERFEWKLVSKIVSPQEQTFSRVQYAHGCACMYNLLVFSLLGARFGHRYSNWKPVKSMVNDGSVVLS